MAEGRQWPSLWKVLQIFQNSTENAGIKFELALVVKLPAHVENVPTKTENSLILPTHLGNFQ